MYVWTRNTKRLTFLLIDTWYWHQVMATVSVYLIHGDRLWSSLLLAYVHKTKYHADSSYARCKGLDLRWDCALVHENLLNLLMQKGPESEEKESVYESWMIYCSEITWGGALSWTFQALITLKGQSYIYTVNCSARPILLGNVYAVVLLRGLQKPQKVGSCLFYSLVPAFKWRHMRN